MKHILPVENPVITHDPPAANLLAVHGYRSYRFAVKSFCAFAVGS